MEIKEVFEPVLNFIKNLQKKEKEPASKQAAKDRLKLVLMQDRASVSPDFFDIMKKEIIDVIKKYIEIDEDALEVELTRGLEAGLEGPALYANIPIKNVKPMAPKADEDDGEDHVIDDDVVGDDISDDDKIVEDLQEQIEAIGPLTEEQADAVADVILTHIEEKAIEEGKSEEKTDGVGKLAGVSEDEENTDTSKQTTGKLTKAKATATKSAAARTTKNNTKNSTTKSTTTRKKTVAKKKAE